MHEEILTPEQSSLLNIVKLFSGDFGLVGGTAIALHLGHRESIDYDLFTFNEFNEKIFRTQLAYFKDIDYSESVVYKEGFEVGDEIIKKALIEFSLEKL